MGRLPSAGSEWGGRALRSVGLQMQIAASRLTGLAKPGQFIRANGSVEQVLL